MDLSSFWVGVRAVLEAVQWTVSDLNGRSPGETRFERTIRYGNQRSNRGLEAKRPPRGGGSGATKPKVWYGELS